MSTADTELSIMIKMTPGPDHHEEPVAPDKTTSDDRTEITNQVDSVQSAESSSSQNTDPTLNVVELNLDLTSQGAFYISTHSDDKQDASEVSDLNEGQLRALLDEAFSYKCPRDREGKSHLFRELLQVVEADETKETRRLIANLKDKSPLSGTKSKKQKRHSVSEHLTHGGSLQNLAQLDNTFACTSSNSSHTYGGNRKKNKKHTGPNVSARQREGGSLPSNVNASHSFASSANFEIFDKKGFGNKKTVYDWHNKEKSKSLDKSSYNISSKKEDKDKDKNCEADIERRNSKSKYETNEMHQSDNPSLEYKLDYTGVGLNDVEVGPIIDRNAGTTVCGDTRPPSLDVKEDEGTEMKIIEPRKPTQFTTLATLETNSTPVDAAVDFQIRDQDKARVSINGAELTTSLSYQAFGKCISGGSSNTSIPGQGKIPTLCPPMPWQSQNITMEGPRHTTHHFTTKDTASTGEKKSLDENGNAVQGYNGERKKTKKKHTQRPNVIEYNAEDVKGHRNEEVDILVKFILNDEPKGKKSGKSCNAIGRVKANSSSSSSSGTKPRSREKDSRREELSVTMQKSNSLEEISKTKLEDLTAEKSICSSGASSVSSQHGTINVSLRRAKQKSTGDSTVDDCRGDRRSWGTEEGQSIYCNDTGDDYASRRSNTNKKINPETEPEPEFLVVTKKKKSKKHRSSNGSRVQNLSASGSYLQSSRGLSNEYQTPLSSELRRKSASSMPPSDKSDSSDLDSVHSLPVTSNVSNHSPSKGPDSSGSTPQASYADITRMAINVSHGLSISGMVPSMLNTISWPSVSPKSLSETDKVPQDYYPSLTELHSERKIKQYNFSHANQSSHLSFDKPPSPSLSKMDSQEETVNEDEQIIEYVRDKRLEQKVNSCTNLNDYNTLESSNNDCQQTNARYNNNNNNNNNNNQRCRRVGYQNSTSREEQIEDNNNPKELSPDSSDTSKLNKTEKMTKVMKEQQNSNVNINNNINNNNNNSKSNTSGNSNNHNPTCNEQMNQDEMDNNDNVRQNPLRLDHKKDSNAKKNISSRPAVILLDETTCDLTKMNDVNSTELTFGFEINELLLSEDVETNDPENPEQGPQVFEGAKFTPYPSTLLPFVNSYISNYISGAIPIPYSTRPPPSPSLINSEDGQQGKEDLSLRYVAPEEPINVQNYNHDKIVSFVGSAWNDIMREIPDTASVGSRIQYYTDQ